MSDNDNNVLTLLTSRDKSELRVSIKQLILNQVERDLEDNGNYLIDVDYLNRLVEESVSEMVEELVEECREELKEKVIKMLEKKLEGIV